MADINSKYDGEGTKMVDGGAKAPDTPADAASQKKEELSTEVPESLVEYEEPVRAASRFDLPRPR